MPGKKIMAIFAMMAVLALCACVEQGTENQTGEVPGEPTEVPPAGTVQQPRRQDTNETSIEEPEQAEEQIEGEVSAVENNTITISTTEGEELVLNVTESTRVTKEGIEELGMGSAGLEQIAEGDSVLVVYNPERMEALSIDVLPAEAEEPIEEPVPEAPAGIPELPAEEPAEPVPSFEAYLALSAIGLAGAAVALTHRKKKE